MEVFGHSHVHTSTERRGGTECGENTQDYHFIVSAHWLEQGFQKQTDLTFKSQAAYSATPFISWLYVHWKPKPQQLNIYSFEEFQFSISWQSNHQNVPLYPQVSTTTFWFKDINARRLKKTKDRRSSWNEEFVLPTPAQNGRSDVGNWRNRGHLLWYLSFHKSPHFQTAFLCFAQTSTYVYSSSALLPIATPSIYR